MVGSIQWSPQHRHISIKNMFNNLGLSRDLHGNNQTRYYTSQIPQDARMNTIELGRQLPPELLLNRFRLFTNDPIRRPR